MKLQLVANEKRSGYAIAGVRLIPGVRSAPPVTPAIEVIEEDTWRILGAPPMASVLEEHPVRLMTDVIGQQPEVPGSVLVRAKHWLAIVHDLDQDPICREVWVRQALTSVFGMAAQRSIAALGMPLLGSLHGCLSPDRSLALLIETLREVRTKYPQRIWLEVQRQRIHSTVRALEALCGNPDTAGPD